MTKLKMGMHNPITAERFHIIKAALTEGISEDGVMAKYGIKRTTLKYIKTSINFYEYRLRTETLPAARKMPTVIAPSSGLAFEDFSYKKKKTPKKCCSMSNDKMKDQAISAVVVITAFACVAIVALAALIVWSSK